MEIQISYKSINLKIIVKLLTIDSSQIIHYYIFFINSFKLFIFVIEHISPFNGLDFIIVYMKILALVLLVALALGQSTCGGNCPSGLCPTCYCGTSTNYVSISTYCSQYSWNQACCQCIASH